jgi:phosphoribosylformimino-5-aminoimidazole carboxamide ribotide isomerase
MEIIPVIDILGGMVVRANGGDREQYPLLQSRLTNSSEPQHVINDLLSWHPFTKIYIADLDAIDNKKRSHALYKDITHKFPKVDFWLDAGIRTQQCWQQFSVYPTVSPVIGSETLVESEWLLIDKVRSNSVLSLDFKNGAFLGLPQLLKQAERWTERVIVMDLDNVGGEKGPNLDQISDLKQRALHSQLVAAGGIRDSQDLVNLENGGIRLALVASALHDGSISKIDLK